MGDEQIEFVFDRSLAILRFNTATGKFAVTNPVFEDFHVLVRILDCDVERVDIMQIAAFGQGLKQCVYLFLFKRYRGFCLVIPLAAANRIRPSALNVLLFDFVTVRNLGEATEVATQ